jgi:hypothetical protein
LALLGGSFRSEHYPCRNHIAASVELGAEFKEKQSWASDQRIGSTKGDFEVRSGSGMLLRVDKR